MTERRDDLTVYGDIRLSNNNLLEHYKNKNRNNNGNND